MDNINLELKNEKKFKSYFVLDIILGIGVIFILGNYLFASPIRGRDVIIHVSSNDSLDKISNTLKVNNVIKFPFILKTCVYLLSGDKNIHSGDYLFIKNESVFSVAMQIAKGKHNVSPVKITFKEGSTNEDIAKLLGSKISSFRRDLFLSDKRSKQGYLFPDTYFFFPLSTTDEILGEITADFNKRISSIRGEIKNSGRNLEETITMASILEKEAAGKDDIYIISGILYKRIRMGMPLQVDAAPKTYKDGGLPDSPISNPGMLSIDAAIHPKESPYLFYLHDKDGIVHYAEDFSEHRSNIARYLK